MKTALITIGSTREYIDPVRYITNESSGQQGMALIKSLIKNNFKVICLHGYLQVKPIVSKFAQGFCDDLALTCMIAANKPIFIAPAMNKEMWANSLIQKNVQLLKDHGHHFIGPDDGSLACGEYGSGRLVDPSEILKLLS